MSTPAPPNQLPTRQQLDEIDALLRRMLSLPSLAGEQPAGPSPPIPAVPSPASVSYPATIGREAPTPPSPAPGEPIVQAWRAEWPPQPSPPPTAMAAWGSPVPHSPSPPPWTTTPTAAQIASSAPFAAPVEMPQKLPQGPFPSEAAASAMQHPSIFIAVLLLINKTFDVLAYLLGPVGASLRGPGRNLLGWTGIVLIAAAAAWALGEWYGYDWPRIDFSRFRSWR